ncbi:MAG: TIGR02221 family CRISPR-associated protein [Candidatus Woesearchaeota archaeon]
MSKKNRKLISVLGSRNYVTVNYDGFDECEYIQEALIRKYKDKLSEVLIFATSDAKEKNWNEYTYEDKNNKKITKMGLKKKIKKIQEEYGLNLEVRLVEIPEGYREEELWEIFNIFIENINKNDKIYFDVTHGFRYLAMLIMNILNYVKLTKNIEVKSIEYGLFEQLGPSFKVVKMPLKERNATILDLTSFDYLNDWVVGVDNFVNTGDADKINQLSGRPIGRMIAQDEKMNTESKELILKISSLIDALKNFNNEVKTARGNILNNTIIKVLILLEEIEEFESSSNNRISPLLKLIDKIKDKFSIFDKNDKKGINNYFQLLKWCEEHKFVQQGLVIFKENMISMIADKLNEPYLPEHMKKADYNYSLIEIREEIGNAIYSLNEKEKNFDPITTQEKFNFIRNEIEKHFNDFIILYNNFSLKRNDVSHFGLRESPTKNSQSIIDKFTIYTDALEKILKKR